MAEGVKCIKCSKEGIEYLRYNGSHLCEDHFLEFVEQRVRKELRRQIDLDGKRKVAVALSGGKDSAVALFLLHQILKPRRDLVVEAITVDEGIARYRPKTLLKAKELTESLGIKHHIISFRQEAGRDLDDLMPFIGDKGPCTYCGVLRRRCMNRVAREIGADVLATGLNLDDTAQSILMNFTRGDLERLARLGPHVRIQPGLIPRIQPLRLIPEKESYLYAMLRELPFSNEECPYADRALRNEYRAIIDDLEDRHPGTRHAILSSYDGLRECLMERHPQSELRVCGCGEPTIRDRCMTCELLESLLSKR
ncbi:MAG: TIGR00269 family protein [Methanomassiliicoccales archaeon]